MNYVKQPTESELFTSSPNPRTHRQDKNLALIWDHLIVWFLFHIIGMSRELRLMEDEGGVTPDGRFGLFVGRNEI